VNETLIANTTASHATFVVKATLNNAASGDDFGLVLTYDNVGKYRSGQVIYEVDSATGVDSNGDPVIWYYLDWHAVGNPGWYTYTVGIAKNIFVNYQFGLFSFGNAAPFANVTLEAYFINGSTPNFNSYWSQFEGAVQVPVTTGDVVRGDMKVDVACAPCDPNLVGENLVFFGAQEQFTVSTVGEYENGVITGTSVDWWETRDFVAGDIIEWEAGDPTNSQDHDFYWFDPSTAASLGLPTSVPGTLPSGYFATGQGDASAIESGLFTASQTGTYFLALDNWGGGSSTWFVDTIVSRGQLEPYDSASETFDTVTDFDPADIEATWTWGYDSLGGLTEGYDHSFGFSLGTYTPTNLDVNLSAVLVYFDNYRAPENVSFDAATETLLDSDPNTAIQDIVTFMRPTTRSLSIGWSADDAEDDPIFYELRAWKGFTPWQPTDESFLTGQFGTSYSWNVQSSLAWEDNFWTLELRARDNTVYGGEATPVQLALILDTEGVVSTVTVTGPGFTSTTTTTTTASPGFDLIALAIGLVVVVPVIAARRRK
jgi:hypothetical protein